jgi:hypothetical protein
MLKLVRPNLLVVCATLAGCAGSSASGPTADFSGDELALVPATRSVVVHADWPALRDSVAGSPAATWLSRKLAVVSQVCGFDPLATLRTATLSQSRDGKELEAILRGIPRDRMLACLPRLAPMARARANVRHDGDTWLVGDATEGIGLRFVSDTTAIVLAGSNVSAARFDALVATRDGSLAASPPFAQIRDALATTHTGWFYATVGDPGRAPVVGLAALYGTVDAGAQLTVAARLRFATPGQASAAIATLHAMAARGSALASAFHAALVRDGSDEVALDVVTDPTTPLFLQDLEDAIQGVGARSASGPTALVKP